MRINPREQTHLRRATCLEATHETVAVCDGSSMVTRLQRRRRPEDLINYLAASIFSLAVYVCRWLDGLSAGRNYHLSKLAEQAERREKKQRFIVRLSSSIDLTSAIRSERQNTRE